VARPDDDAVPDRPDLTRKIVVDACGELLELENTIILKRRVSAWWGVLSC